MTARGLAPQKKPAVIGDGRLFFGAQKFLRPLRHATLTELEGRKWRSERR
jgi:hypothetical protein